jgi:hypothetical protein
MGLDGPRATGAWMQRNPFSTSIPHTLKTGILWIDKIVYHFVIVLI